MPGSTAAVEKLARYAGQVVGQPVYRKLEIETSGISMRAVLQRVDRASVSVEGITIAGIESGILALAAFSREDSREDLLWMARKIVELRIFDDSEGKLNLSLQDTSGQLLVVSQFTLYGDCRKGRRPSYSEAAQPAEAEKLYDEFIQILQRQVPDVQSGRFQAMMKVSLINSGPVTLILDSRRAPAATLEAVNR